MKSVLSVSDAFKLMAKLTTISWELEDNENIMSARSKYAHIITKLHNIPENYALNFWSVWKQFAHSCRETC